MNNKSPASGSIRLASIAIALAPILLLLAAGSLQAEPLERSFTRSTGCYWSYGDRSASYDITDDDIAPTPEWADPSREPPPLSIGQAISVSKQQLALYVPEVPDWVLGSMKLELFDEPGRWYYVVSWRPASDEHDHWLHVPVLMNGLAVKLTLEDPAPTGKSE